MGRLLRVLHLIPNLEQGGAEAMLANLVGEGGEVDHQICTMITGEPFFRIESDRLHIGPSRRGHADVSLAKHIRTTILRLRPDVVHTWMYHANLASVLGLGLDARIVWSIHNTHLRAGEAKATTRLVNRCCSVLSSVVPSAIVYVSQAARDLHEARGYDPRRGLVIPNGVDTGRFSVQSASPDPRIKPAPDRYVIGMIARFDVGKGHAFFIDAVKSDPRLRDLFHLVFVGRNCTASGLREYLSAAGLLDNATLLEAQVEIERIYAACDAIVLPSFGEAFPMSVIEAASMGKPVIASRVGDVPALGLPETHLFEAGNIVDCVRALHEVVSSTDLQPSVQRAVAERFSMNNVRRRYVNLYRDVIKQSSVAARE